MTSLPPPDAVPVRGNPNIWRLDGDAVLRRRPLAFAAHIAWVHQFLSAFHSESVETPRPLPRLDGESVVEVDGAAWETLSYVPGQTVGWKRRPTMVELGAFLADFHEASTHIRVDDRIGPTVPISALTEDSTWANTTVHRVIRDAVDDLRRGLERIDHGAAPRTVIHGDFTNHNVVATGQPLTPTGIIDFSNAYTEATLADIGFALWRSGRPSQRAIEYDRRRVSAYIRGYGSRRALDDAGVEACIVYLRARGLQIVAKQLQRGEPVDGPLISRLAWMHDHLDDFKIDVG